MPKSIVSTAIRVAVIDDHPLMRAGIVQALSREADIEVVAEGQASNDAVAIAQTHLPDVMLVDINMPGGGLDALRRISESCPAVACIVITVREDEETVGHALRIGARGYVLKGISGWDLAQTIRSINQGEVYITPSLAARLLIAQSGGLASVEIDQKARVDDLTEREIQILRLIAKGMINKQIGLELELSEKTVKHYVTNVLQKLQVRNRVEAALIAQRELKERE